MTPSLRLWLAAAAWTLSCLAAGAQKPTPVAPPPAAPGGVAATVNGQPVSEAALQRALDQVPPAKRAEARPELLNYLIDNVLIEQYLLQMQVQVGPPEVEKKIEEMKADAKKQGMDFAKILHDVKLTEAELREHVTADLRWEKYAKSQATDQALKALFQSVPEIFDGTMVRARHILLTPAPDDARAAAEAQAQLLAYKKQIEDQVAVGLAKLPPTTDNLGREKARASLTDEAFAVVAREKSACPSKAQGGDVGWFQRAGVMVEPFAKAAFALKPYQMSDVVKTPFGYHLILATERKPGREVKFEDVKREVLEVFGDRLRESVAAQARQRSKIVVTSTAKP